MASIWDNCLLDSEQENCVKIIKANTKFSVPSDAVKREAADGDMHEENSVGVDTNPMVIYSQKNLVATENSCKSFVQDLDGMISMLDNITSAHNDVTGRTNSLMRNCEDLLERQVNYTRITVISCALTVLLLLSFRYNRNRCKSQ